MRTEAASTTLADGIAPRLADHYTDMVALNWRRRARLLQSPANSFADLVDWDDRIQAGLDALRLLGPAAQDHLQQCLLEPINAGEAFAVLALGLSVQHQELVETAAAIVRGLPGQTRLPAALVAALEWSPPHPLWLQTLQSLPIQPRLMVLATRHRNAPQLLASTFEALQADPDSPPEVLAAALRCLQYKGDARAVETGIYCLESGDACLRLASARALLAICPAHEEAATAALLRLVREGGAQREAATRCLALHAPRQCLPLLAELQQDQAGEDLAPVLRLHLQAMGWAGQIQAVPRLIEHLDNPQQARIAAASITLLTGSDPVRDGWQGSALMASDRSAHDSLTSTMVPPDPDAVLPWPSREAFAAQWRQTRQRFTGVRPLMGGEPATSENLRALLREGPLAWRPLAAARLQRLTGEPLFPTSLPAQAQAAQF